MGIYTETGAFDDGYDGQLSNREWAELHGYPVPKLREEPKYVPVEQTPTGPVVGIWDDEQDAAWEAQKPLRAISREEFNQGMAEIHSAMSEEEK